jgi:phosphate:Na+ symporter
VLSIMSLTYSHFVTPAGALALVLGANLGSAINPVIESTRRGDPASYRLPVGNLFNRYGRRRVGRAVPAPDRRRVSILAADMAKMTAAFHMGFKLAMAATFIGLLDPLAWLLEKVLPARRAAGDASAPRHLDDGALDTPSLALTDAARETLHMGDIVEAMLRQVMTAILTNKRTLAGEVSRKDNAVNRLDEAIKLYVTRLTRGSLDERESRRAMEIISFTINLEHIGDIIDQNLSELAVKKITQCAVL